ncbi:hypothetical protein [Agromyces sp. ZXT2-3]|uniref:hypothetical protein n=1 Tax=Agromyces sp. ZXT2-3 TaxID=3461152 RepID=UPI0040551595
MVWSLDVMFDDLSSESLGPPLVFVSGFLLLVGAAIAAWFELQYDARIRFAEDCSPVCFIMPVVLTKQLPAQVDEAMAGLGQRRVYVPRQGHALLAADADGIELRAGWGSRPVFSLPSGSIRSVEIGTIAFPLGDTTAIDVVLDTVGGQRISLMPMRSTRRYWGTESREIIEQYAAGLREALRVSALRTDSRALDGTTKAAGGGGEQRRGDRGDAPHSP